MQFGYDEDKNRIRPSYSGQRATCPLCEGTMVAKCGEIYVWHWQHHFDSNCDPWKEHETEWHREWKAKFPDSWQEVIIESYGGKHIADIKTPNGIVIEFQNSSISPSTIRIREEFYEKMIWVVNAESFKNHFAVSSIVNSKLKSHNREYYFELKSLETQYKDDLKSYEDLILKNETKSYSKCNDIKYRKEDLEEYKKILLNAEEFTNQVLNKWCQGSHFLDYKISNVIDKIENNFKKELYETSNEIAKLETRVISFDQVLLNVQKLDPFPIGKVQFRFIKYNEIPPNAYHKARAISKDSRKTFFPLVYEFKSEMDFLNFQYRQSLYDFVIDPTEKIGQCTAKKETVNHSLSDLKESLIAMKKNISNEIINALRVKIHDLESEIEELNEEWDILIAEKNTIALKKLIFIGSMEKDLKKSKSEIEKKMNQEKFKIMNQNKGLYSIGWKHRRKSWDKAEKPIFFDIGEDYLFYQKERNLFKKVGIDAFLSKYALRT